MIGFGLVEPPKQGKNDRGSGVRDRAGRGYHKQTKRVTNKVTLIIKLAIE
uniref:Uncharacterized protein n=2 Tax=Vibrio TaxID=662 RepID=A0A0H3ZJI0_9VIBR|nr:hypothetical protein [Vibrio tasmaniensis]AKN40829.1 hypothetical protein [Vibrio sp. 1F_189]